MWPVDTSVLVAVCRLDTVIQCVYCACGAVTPCDCVCLLQLLHSIHQHLKGVIHTGVTGFGHIATKWDKTRTYKNKFTDV